MGMCICAGSVMQCPFGITAGTLNVLPGNKVMSSMPVANVMDNKPLVNIPSFGMCSSMANPQVAAATAAALGALTPMPCVPVLSSPWAPGSPTVLIGGYPALNNSSKLICNWGGVIQILSPSVMTIQIP